MVEDDGQNPAVDNSLSTEEWLSRAQALVPKALEKAKQVEGDDRAAEAVDVARHSPFCRRAWRGPPADRYMPGGDSVSQSAAACALKNISVVPEARQTLAEEGIVKVMINLLDCGILLGSKEYAAECLQNLTTSNDDLKRAVISENGVRSLLTYLDGPLPQEPVVGALMNLISLVSADVLVSGGVLPRLVHVLRSGSLGAQQTAASAICRICGSAEMKRALGEAGCVPFLVAMLEAKSNGVREVAAQAIASLMTVAHNSALCILDLN